MSIYFKFSSLKSESSLSPMLGKTLIELLLPLFYS